MEDEQIIDLYFERNEQAIFETNRKYGGYCYCVADAVLNSREDSEEVVSDTWHQAWKSMPPQRPNVLKMYLAKITRNLAFSAYRSRTAAKRGGGELEVALEELEGCLSDVKTPEQQLDFQELVASVRHFLDTIPEREQNIFIRRYFFVEKTAAIASRYGLRQNNVQQILSRTRRKLKSYLIQEGYER